MRPRYLKGVLEGRELYGTVENKKTTTESQDHISNSDYPTCAKCGHEYDKHHGGGISSSCQGGGCSCDGYRMTNQNGSCPICKDEMGMHDDEGKCDVCGEQCG